MKFVCLREMFELMSTPKGQQRPDAPEPSELIQLLIQKDKTIKECIVTGTCNSQLSRSQTLMSLSVLVLQRKKFRLTSAPDKEE